MPLILIACCYAVLLTLTMVDSQVEYFHTFAALVCSSIVLVVTALIISLSIIIPIVLIASSFPILLAFAAVNSQVKYFHTFAALVCSSIVLVVTALIISLSIIIPIVLIASSFPILLAFAAVNSQVKYFHTLTTLLGSGIVLIVATIIIGITIAIPIVLIAGGSPILFALTLVDSQVEYFGTVASSSTPIVYGITIRVVTTFGISLTIPPIVLITSSLPILLILAIINSQMQYFHAFATIL